MPCMLDDNEERIRLAQYGTSNIGRFKTLYRRGLEFDMVVVCRPFQGALQLIFPDTLLLSYKLMKLTNN